MPLVTDIRDIAQHHTARRAPRMRFAPVAPAGHSLMRPPLFLLGHAGPALLRDLAGQTLTPQIGCYTMRDALVAPTGIPIKHGVAFHGDAFLHPRHLAVAIADRLNADPPAMRDIAGPVAVLCGPAHETYGHWLVDFLPRLWVLHQAGHDLASLRFVVPADLTPLGFELLHLCGIPDDRLVRYRHWQELLRVEQLILPTGLRHGDRFAPQLGLATQFWLARAGLAAPQHPGPATLFLPRADGTSRRLVNRARIESIAIDHGLTIERPEHLPLPGQIARFAGARLIVGEYGSALHNSIFAGAGAVVCALRGNARHPSLLQSGLATALRQDVGYVFGGTEGAEADQAFYIDEDDFRLALALVELRKVGGNEAISPKPPSFSL